MKSRRKLLGDAVAIVGGTIATSAFSPFSWAARSLPGKSASQGVSGAWIATTQSWPWQVKTLPQESRQAVTEEIEILLDQPLQTIDGFGACFNELGWDALCALELRDRGGILSELFSPGRGCNLTLCRMPVGANDFSRDWYSYDETSNDFELKQFNISNDFDTLIPFIKSAQKCNPALRLWASPWSPPTWMKYNKHYAEIASSAGTPENGLRLEQVGKEGTDMFVQQARYFATYANYFARFIEAYKAQGIDIGMVMPQNEFNSAQPFPSCTWTPEGLTKFIRVLGPRMHKLGVQVFFGTMERPDERLLDTVMSNPVAGQYVRGVGLQWAGKGAVAGVHARYPGLRIYQSEQECGDGRNDWKYCVYTWSLMRHYFENGANAYMYWNIALKQGGLSRWGWAQNSLVTIDAKAKTFYFNYEFYLFKHLSHFVQTGGRRLETKALQGNALAFENPDRSVALILHNAASTDKWMRIKLGRTSIDALLQPDSFNTFFFRADQHT